MEVPRRDTLARLPLAEAVLTLWRWVAHSGALDQIFDDNRGRWNEKILSFSLLVYLIRDALLDTVAAAARASMRLRAGASWRPRTVPPMASRGESPSP